MNFHPDERVVVFIDGANLHAATRGLGFVIDYKKLLNLLQTRGRLVRALYYTTVFDDDEFSSVQLCQTPFVGSRQAATGR